MEIVDLIELMKSSIKQWHDLDLKIFENNDYNNSNLESSLIKLSYHNYVGWHMIEQYQNADDNVVKFVYEGGLFHNSARNFCMQVIDEFYVNIQNPNSEPHSEGMGNIFDKLSNDYIKYLHLIESKDTRSSLLDMQVNYHQKCLIKLDKQIKEGDKSIIVFQKFKVNGYNE